MVFMAMEHLVCSGNSEILMSSESLEIIHHRAAIVLIFYGVRTLVFLPRVDPTLRETVASEEFSVVKSIDK